MRHNKIHRLLLMVAGAAVLTAAMAVAQGVAAQGDKEGRHGWKGGHDKAFSQLNLTDTQKEQMKAMHESARQEMQAIRNDSSLTKEQRREKMRSAMKADHEKMLGILTPEQREQIKQFRANHKGRGHRRNKGDGNGAPPA